MPDLRASFGRALAENIAFWRVASFGAAFECRLRAFGRDVFEDNMVEDKAKAKVRGLRGRG